MAQLGILGGITFETSDKLVRNFGAYSDNVSARIEAHEIGGSEPVLEYVGPGTRSISLPIVLNGSLGVDVEGDISRLHEYCSRGELLTFIIGQKPVGGSGAKWLIESVDVTRTYFNQNGSAHIAEINLELQIARTAHTPAAVSSTIDKQNVQKVKV